jgi:uncharacterized protein (DUF1501 family)
MLVASAALPALFARAAEAAQAAGPGASAYGDDTILVVLQLSGGNDGLNTVVPYGLDGYRQLRPTIGISEADVLPLTDHLGLHPQMGKLHRRYQAGEMAIIQGVGYPSPNLSHFRSMEIWHTATPDSSGTTGWLSTYLASEPRATDVPTYAVSVTDGLSAALKGGVSAPTIRTLEAYRFRTDERYPGARAGRLALANWIYERGYGVRPLEEDVARTAARALASAERVQSAARAYQSDVEYPRFPLAGGLKTIAQLIAANLGTRVYYTAFGGFDTHSAQVNTHARLLGGFADSVDAFFQDLARMGAAHRVLVMTFSEFGRRAHENGSLGTDHGTAGPMFIIGPRVQGGVYGEHPNLQSLDANGNVRYGVDFRAVYATVLQGWLGAEPGALLGVRYESLGFV